METLPQDFVGYIKDIQTWAGHESHSFRLAKSLDIQLQVGSGNYVMTETQPRPTMVLSSWDYGGDTHAVRHELNHILLYWSGLEQSIYDEYGPDMGQRIMENLCNQATAFLQITQPMVDKAVKRYGVSAKAVRYLQKLSGASPEAALRRLIYDDHRGIRAGFLSSGLYIIQTEDCNHGLPFFRLDRVPDPTILFDKYACLSMAKLPYAHLSIGVVGW